MPRPPLPLGTWGEIRAHPGPLNEDGQPHSYRAIANYRDFDGRTRQVERWGKTEATAKHRLRSALKDRAALARRGELSGASRFRTAAELWLTRMQRLVDQEKRSPGTHETYRRHLDRNLLPALGDVRLAEITTPLLDKFLGRLQAEIGTPTARTCRSILSGVVGLGVRYGAITTNPVREVDRLEGKPKRAPRALTKQEREVWLTQLEADPQAVRKDLPDLCQFMLATGVRLGEALGVLWSEVDFVEREVSITSTVIRLRGVGLVRKPTKSSAGQRALRLPSWALDMLRQRYLVNPRLDSPVFPDSRGGVRDSSNTQRDLRDARGSEGFAWVTSHNFRKTAATILDEEGLSAREIADQLGHARPSMTQDVYLGRKATNARAADALERAAGSKSDSNTWENNGTGHSDDD